MRTYLIYLTLCKHFSTRRTLYWKIVCSLKTYLMKFCNSSLNCVWLQKRKDELEAHIRSQQDELRQNQGKIEQQKRLLASYEYMQQMSMNRLSGSHQFGMMPGPFVPMGSGMPPMYSTGYPPAFGSATLPPTMIPRVANADGTFTATSSTQM